ncbi:hypothetical protein MRX96_048477 [Rhipicephalus microplus]
MLDLGATNDPCVDPTVVALGKVPRRLAESARAQSPYPRLEAHVKRKDAGVRSDRRTKRSASIESFSVGLIQRSDDHVDGRSPIGIFLQRSVKARA